MGEVRDFAEEEEKEYWSAQNKEGGSGVGARV